MKVFNIIGFLVLFIILTLGIVFMSLLSHEMYHMFDLDGATSICFVEGARINDYWQNGTLLAYTKINSSVYANIEDYNRARALSEKIAYIVEISVIICIAMYLGFWIRGYFNG